MALIRSLRLILLVGLAALIGGIVFSLTANARYSPPGAVAAHQEQAAAGATIAQRASNVEILRTRRGAPALRLEAASSRSWTSGRMELLDVTFRLFSPDARETIVTAPTATSLPEPAGASAAAPPEELGEIGSWLLEGGVSIAGADNLTVTTPRLSYLEADGTARTDETVSFRRGAAIGSATGMTYEVLPQIVRFEKDVSASMPLGTMGMVEVDAETASHDLRHRSFTMHRYRARTARGEVLSGARLLALFREDGGMERLEGSDGFTLETTHAIAATGPPSPLSRLLALEGTRTMRGQRLAMTFGEGTEPVSLEVSGEANLVASAGGNGGAPSSLAAQTLVFDLVNGNLSRARAIGDVRLQGAPADPNATGLRLTSENLEAILDPNLGSILNLEGQGEIHLSDQEMQSQGSRTFLDPNTDVITLSGERGAPATATWLGRRIQADRIEADRRRKTLSAKGGVRASYQPQPRPPAETARNEGALPFFREGETIHVMAGTLTFAERGKVAQYRDRVRLWQGESRLEATEVDVNETTGVLEARGDVTSTFRQTAIAGEAPAGPSSEIVTVAAASMRYERGASLIVYSGKVLVTQGPLRVTAETMLVTLDPATSEAQRMHAEGRVELRDGERIGKGDRLEVDLRTSTMKLSGKGREAIVQDASGQQVVRGVALTMDRTGDRILVESELGGRTWITLKPRQKGAPGIAPDSRD